MSDRCSCCGRLKSGEGAINWFLDEVHGGFLIRAYSVGGELQLHHIIQHKELDESDFPAQICMAVIGEMKRQIETALLTVLPTNGTSH
jgi:hypothetical protein